MSEIKKISKPKSTTKKSSAKKTIKRSAQTKSKQPTKKKTSKKRPLPTRPSFFTDYGCKPEGKEELNELQKYMIEVMWQYHHGDKAFAKNEVIISLQLYIYKKIHPIASNGKGREDEGKKELRDDLFQSCVEHVLMHLDKFDPKKSPAIKYFGPAITGAISRYINYSKFQNEEFKTVRPAYQYEKAYKELEGMGIEPTFEAIAAHTGLSYSKVEYGYELNLLSEHTTYETDTEFENAVHANNKTPEKEYLESEGEAIFDEAFSAVSAEEREIFELYYGITGDRHSYLTLSKMFNISPKDIQIIIEKTRRKLANNKKLQEYYHRESVMQHANKEKKELSFIPTKALEQEYDLLDMDEDELIIVDPEDDMEPEAPTQQTILTF